jgi:membrane peptidoglycan carboxypeptidase
LVKNVFLTREKTLSRKLEEILLVYILENNRIASKERMLEVYFNIIEWGPDVYGIGEAASYYFQKSPSQLTLDECVYLASIIPRPKGFMWQFNDEGKLKPFAVKHNDYIKKLMLRRGLITAEDTIAQSGQIDVTGRARSRIKIKETNPFGTDSTGVQDFFFNLSKEVF